jgi:hypothetical protein
LSLANLVWRVENNPAAPLAWYERYRIDLALWTYRYQLGEGGIEIPTERPERRDYLPDAHNRQINLF